jgi:hypothetical protein
MSWGRKRTASSQKTLLSTPTTSLPRSSSSCQSTSASMKALGVVATPVRVLFAERHDRVGRLRAQARPMAVLLAGRPTLTVARLNHGDG